MLSKSSILCSRFLMWAGRWQLRKHTGWPNMVILALTPPLFPLKWQERAKHAASKGPLMQTRFKIKQTSAYINQICAREQGHVVFFPQHSQHQKARQSAAAALTSKRRRLHQQQPGVMLTSTCTGRSHTDICTQACMHLLAGGSTHTISSLATPSDMSPLQLLQHHESQLVSKQHSVMCSTYPVSPKSCACTLCLHTSEKWKVAEFRENQQQHSLHSLGRHLNTWDGWKIIYP